MKMNELNDKTIADNDLQRIAIIKFLGCSLIGVMLFLVPMHYEGSGTIVLGIMVKKIQTLLGENMALFTIPIFVCGGLISAVYNLTPRAFAEELPASKQLIASHWIWCVFAISGAVFSLMVFFGVGPEWIVSKETGVTAYIDVAGLIFLLIGLGCLFLPFLTDYGLLEFVGTMLSSVYQKLFNLPGRATIDTLASWVGSSSIAVIMTGRQYERGYYTAREAVVISTNFSVVSIPFVVFIAQIAGLGEYFFQLYASMLFICVICAIITPKLPPLRFFENEYYAPVGKQLDEKVEDGDSKFGSAVNRALKVSSKAESPAVAMKKGFLGMLDIFFMMMPAAMTIEFLTLAAFHHTPVFQILSAPLIPVLELLQVPEAAATAPGVIVGLLDQFVPAIIASGIPNPISSFILAGLSVTQLIFFAETAILIKRTKLPVSNLQLVAIFCIRTAIALPILALIAHIIF